MNTRSTIPAEVNNFYDRTLLRRAIPAFLHTMFAQVRDIPKNSGTSTIKFRRYGNFSAATSPLTEGVTPSGQNLAPTDITATVAQYGDYTSVSDVLTYESEDRVLMEAAEILGDQAGDTIDQLTRDILAAGSNAIYSGSGNTQNDHVAAGDVISAANVRSAVLTLKLNNTKKLKSMVNPTDGYNTTPLNACFVGIVHPSISATLKTLTGWIDVQKYPSQKDVMPNEIGTFDEVRFIETTNAKVFTAGGTGGIDVYGTIIFGSDAYGISRISGESLKNIVKPLGSSGTADPLDQRATSGWKATFVAKILNDNFMTRIVSAAS